MTRIWTANTDRQLFITLKDHKDNFKSNTKWGLINPDKNQMKKFSKYCLETIISNANKTLKYNQWKNTSTVTEWFKYIPNKRNCRFIKFDIFEYCP